MEGAFGGFVAFLSAKGLHDSCLVVFMWDQGEEFGQHALAPVRGVGDSGCRP
jgi:hypothetical protein